MEYKILPCGDTAVTVEFSRSISDEAGKCVMSFTASLTKTKTEGITDIIPTYRSVTVCFDPLVLSYKKLSKLIECCCKKTSVNDTLGKIYKIPVCYGGRFGEDLKFVAVHTGLDEREVVRRHISIDYLINMIGFLPGFPYLSGMDESIQTPRLAEPRTVIPAGSVGIGGVQTGIYPMESPGGWQLIGRTPVKVYDPGREPAVIYKAGDRIRFYPITETEYDQIKIKAENGTYVFETV